MSGFGGFLAIATAFSGALGCVVHTTASRVVGIPAVMLIRQPLASVVLGIFCLVMGDLWLPSLHLFWLAAASGVFGIIIGDACQYAGALTIGLRPAQVCQSLSSCFTALFGSIYLNEYIGLQGWLGMFVATCGVILVVLSEQRDAHNPPVSSKQRNKGVIISLLAAVFVALGIVFSKQALQEGIGALPLAFYRNAISTAGICNRDFPGSFLNHYIVLRIICHIYPNLVTIVFLDKELIILQTDFQITGKIHIHSISI